MPWNPRITTAAAHAAAVSAADATKTPRRFIDLKGVMRHEKRLRLFGKRKQIQLLKLHTRRSAPGGARMPLALGGPRHGRRRGSGAAGVGAPCRGGHPHGGAPPRFVCCTRQAGRGGRPLAKPRRAGGRPDARRPVWQAPVRARGAARGPAADPAPSFARSAARRGFRWASAGKPRSNEFAVTLAPPRGRSGGAVCPGRASRAGRRSAGSELRGAGRGRRPTGGAT